jgi:hypothetical protein
LLEVDMGVIDIGPMEDGGNAL